MFDCLAVLFVVIGFGLAFKRRYVLAGAAFSLAMLTKLFIVLLIPLLVAWMLRRDGVNRRGVSSVFSTVIGFLAAFIIVELPSAASGDFWEPVFFLTNRAGIDAALIEGMVLPAVFVLAAIIAAGWIWCSRNADRVHAAIAYLSTPQSEKKVRKGLAAIALLGVLAVAALSISAGNWSDMGSAVKFMADKATVMAYIVSVAIELYLAYLMMFRTDGGREAAVALFFLAAMTVILWPPLPQYPVFVIPFAAVYAAVYRPGLVKPVFLMGLATPCTTYLPAGSPSCIHSRRPPD